jgi:hypothetical protein
MICARCLRVLVPPSVLVLMPDGRFLAFCEACYHAGVMDVERAVAEAERTA